MKNEDVKAEEKPYTLRISENIYCRIENILKAFNYLGMEKHTKKSWLTECVESKLEKEQSLSIENIPKPRRLFFKIDKLLDDRIKKNVDTTKQFVDSFSKKQWFMEAILEQLEKDETIVKDSLRELSEK